MQKKLNVSAEYSIQIILFKMGSTLGGTLLYDR